nr:GNAT family N-acetyltransferase [Sphingobium sp. Ant17]
MVVVEPALRDPATLRMLAILRMTVFRNWPYLYDGSMAYEMEYLSAFLGDPAAVMIVARVSDIVIGLATASPLSGQPRSISEPLVEAGFDTASTFYFGESVLLPQFRGKGIGHSFFDHREAAARSAGASSAAFCVVVREDEHPSRPSDPRDLRMFWRKRGYTPIEGATTTIDWKDRNAAASSPHPMQVWAKRL